MDYTNMQPIMKKNINAQMQEGQANQVDVMQQSNIIEQNAQQLIHGQENAFENNMQQLHNQEMMDISMQKAIVKLQNQQESRNNTFVLEDRIVLPAVKEATLTQEEENQINASSKSEKKKAEAKKSKLKSKRSKMDANAEKKIKDYKKACSKNNPKLVIGDSREALASEYFKKNILDKEAYKDENNKAVSQRELFDKVVIEKDYSHLEQMNVFLRNSVATEYIRNMKLGAAVKSEEAFVNSLFNEEGVKGLLNPVLRIGISLCMHTEIFAEGLKCEFTKRFNSVESMQKIDALINAKVMAETMRTIPDEKALIKEFTKDKKVGLADAIKKKDEAVKANTQAQLFIAKTLFAAHMSRMKTRVSDRDGLWDGPMANAFSHCSRVSYVLPGMKENETTANIDKTIDAFLGKNKGRDAGFKKRTAATHAIRRKSKKSNGQKFTELKKKLGWYWGQNGMNVAVGGLSKNGITGKGGADRMLLNDGSCGHLYMHLEEGDTNNYSGVMVGFESDGPGVYNQTGHRHGWGNPEFASSFGGQRTDEIGNKYGGRVVDLSGVDSQAFQTLMDGFEKMMTKLLSSTDEESKQNLIKYTDMLVGAYMSNEAFNDIALKCLDYSSIKDNEDKNELLSRIKR